jgi:hypothetical protein
MGREQRELLRRLVDPIARPPPLHLLCPLQMGRMK